MEASGFFHCKPDALLDIYKSERTIQTQPEPSSSGFLDAIVDAVNRVID